MPLAKSAGVRRAKTGAGRRAMEAREAKVIENPKRTMILKGRRSTALLNELLSMVHILKKPDVEKLTHKNDILPFEQGGDVHLQNLASKCDCSMFIFGNTNKKRPDNLVIGRMFDFNILDMLEFGVENYKPKSKTIQSSPNSAPLLVFNGDDYDATDATRTMRSLLTDVFRAPSDIQRLNLAGVDRVICFTLVGAARVRFAHYHIVLKKIVGSRLPRAELEEIGPSFDLVLRRSRVAQEAMMRTAMRQARDPRVDRVTKNVTKNQLGDKHGRIHVGKQDLSGLATARMKGLGKKRKNQDGANDSPNSPKRVRFEE